MEWSESRVRERTATATLFAPVWSFPLEAPKSRTQKGSTSGHFRKWGPVRYQFRPSNAHFVPTHKSAAQSSRGLPPCLHRDGLHVRSCLEPCGPVLPREGHTMESASVFAADSERTSPCCTADVHRYYWPDKRPQHWGSNCILFFRGCMTMCSAATEIGR